MTTTVSFAGMLPVLLRRKRLLMLSGVIMAFLSFGVSKILPLGYVSEGSLIIDNRQTSGSESSSSQTVLTEVDYLQSWGLILAAVQKYKLDEAPNLIPEWRLPASLKRSMASNFDEALRYWHSLSGGNIGKFSERDELVMYIQKHLTVGAKEKSFVISVSFEAGSPQTAALVANAIMSTYLAGVEAAKQDRITQADKLTNDQIVKYQKEVADTEQRVTTYVAQHSLPQVQGSQTAALELSKAQEQLVLAEQDLTQKQAALDTVNSTSVAGSMESINSKSIQLITDTITKTQVQLDVLASYDPRRIGLVQELSSLRSQLAAQKKLIYEALARDVVIARSHVASLEMAIEKEKAVAQSSSVADASLRQLMSDLDARRQLYVSFVTQAGQARIAAIQAPTAHQLFTGLPPDRPAHAFGMLSLVLGMMLGTIGASSYVVLGAMFSSRINTADEMMVIAGLPVIGSLPRMQPGELRKVPLYSAPQMAETFRAMWLTMRPQAGEAATVLITSSEIGEGKTTVAMSLAQRFADDDFRVLLIDADLRHPRLSSLVQGRNDHTLQSVVSGEVPLTQAIRHIQPNLDCLLTTISNNSAKILASRGFTDLLAAAAGHYEFVILDSPPTLQVADPIIIGKLCRYIVYVVQSGRLSSELITEGIRRFPEDDRRKIVTLLNRVPRKQLNRRDYYSGYITAGTGRG